MGKLDDTAKCPHCGVAYKHEYEVVDLDEAGTNNLGDWTIFYSECPTCEQFTIWLNHTDYDGPVSQVDERMIFPSVSQPNVPYSDDVGHEFYDDYAEASAVLSVSPKASAALSRRLLQHILREKAGVKKGDLGHEIEEFIAKSEVPEHIRKSVDAVRNIGNFAAHPIKSTSTGEVVEVEPDEAAWNLEIIEELFELYFLQPARVERRKAALNKKLADAGKKPLA